MKQKEYKINLNKLKIKLMYKNYKNNIQNYHVKQLIK